MIEDKNSLIEKLEEELNEAKKIVADNSELFEECKTYHDSWISGAEGRSADLCISDNFIGVNLTITMIETDSMKDVNLFIDEIPYELIKVREYTDGKWIQFQFTTKSGNLTVFCNYDRSKHCKLVETGKFMPVYERVCLTAAIGCIIGGIVNCYVPDNGQYLWGFLAGTAVQTILQIVR